MEAVKKIGSFINKLLGLMLVLGALSACIVWDPLNPAFVGEVDSCNFIVNQYTGEGARWDKDQFPILFAVHESVLPEAEKNFIAATEAWNLAWANFLEEKGVRFFDLFAVDTTYLKTGTPKSDNQNIIYFLGNKFSAYAPKAEIQAITSVISSGSRIKDTDILVNNESEWF